MATAWAGLEDWMTNGREGQRGVHKAGQWGAEDTGEWLAAQEAGERTHIFPRRSALPLPLTTRRKPRGQEGTQLGGTVSFLRTGLTGKPHRAARDPEVR